MNYSMLLLVEVCMCVCVPTTRITHYSYLCEWVWVCALQCRLSMRAHRSPRLRSEATTRSG